MDLPTLQTWLDAMARAWEARDPQAATELFSVDAVYHADPFEEPMVGREAIHAYWAEVPRRQRNITVRCQALTTDGALGVARWQASFERIPSGERAELDGAFVLRFDVEGRCRALEEWWHARPAAEARMTASQGPAAGAPAAHAVELPRLPAERAARVDVLTVGYTGPRTASTCSVVRDDGVVLIIDPGTVASRADILDPLHGLHLAPEAVTDVVFSHHHPDHTVNAALFPAARFHDHWAIYHHDDWQWRDADGFELSLSIRLVRTPGHTPEDITTLVGTPEGIVALTHLWWRADGPADDPYATDAAALHRHRARILQVANRIIPAHGQPFVPSDATPR